VTSETQTFICFTFIGHVKFILYLPCPRTMSAALLFKHLKFLILKQMSNVPIVNIFYLLSLSKHNVRVNTRCTVEDVSIIYPKIMPYSNLTKKLNQ